MITNNDYYLLIEWGYEGIERLVMPSNEPSILVNEINKIRNQIKIVLKKKENFAAENNIVDNYAKDELWGDLYVNEKITQEEYDLADMNPKSLCIMKWDGQNFKCCCKELCVNIDNEVWLF